MQTMLEMQVTSRWVAHAERPDLELLEMAYDRSCNAGTAWPNVGDRLACAPHEPC